MKRLALLAVVALGLTGCSAGTPDPGPSAADSAAAVETAFLTALVEGDGEAALALTTLSQEDIPCTELFSDYADLQLGIVKPTTGKATVDEKAGTATVEFSYSMVIDQLEEITGTHTLVKKDDSWLIEFPEEYRLTVAAPTQVVGQVGVTPTDEIMAGTMLCAAPIDGSYELPALPGRYVLSTDDPTDVFERNDNRTVVFVSDKPATDPPTELVYLDDSYRDIKASQIRAQVATYVDACAASRFTDPNCQDGLPVPEGPVSISEYPQLDDITIFSEDGLTWRFTAAGEDYLFQRNGAIEAVEIYFSGTVVSAGTIYLSIVLD